tara:strand:- start:4039 stop:6558 length:2520 start_codon:yes stop_codon:yes gene_type:complete
MDIKVTSLSQSAAPQEAFGSYSASIGTRSTFGDNLQKLGSNLNTIKKRKERESDALTSDSLYSQWSARFSVAKEKLRSSDMALVKEGRAELDALNPDTFNFSALAEESGLPALNDEKEFARYKNNALQNWYVEDQVAGIREQDRNRAKLIKENVNGYIQENANKLDPLKAYDSAFVEKQINYFNSEPYKVLAENQDETTKALTDTTLTGSLSNILEHNFQTAKTPAEYDEALRLFNLTKDSIPASKFKQEFQEKFAKIAQTAYDTTHNTDLLEAQLDVAYSNFKNFASSIKSTTSINEKSQSAAQLLERADIMEDKLSLVIDKSSSEYLNFQSRKEMLELYVAPEGGTSVYHKAVHAVLNGLPVSFGQLTEGMKSTDASRFEDDVRATVTEFRTRLENNDMYAFTLIDSDFSDVVQKFQQGLISPAEFALEYDQMSKEYNKLEGIVVPRFSVKNRLVETFSAKRGDVEAREAYINEAVEVNRFDSGQLFTQAGKAQGDEKFLLTVAASSLVNGVNPLEHVQNFNRLLNVGDNATSENTPKLDLFAEYVASRNLESELGNLVRTYSLEQQEMADTYQTLQNGVVASYLKNNPDASMKEVYAHVRDIEEDIVNSFGYVRNINGRNTFVIPQLITDDISTSLGGGFFSEDYMEGAPAVAGPYQLYTNKLLQSEGVRMVEASLSVELAIQMQNHTEAFLKKLEAAGVDPQQVMPDVYRAKSTSARAKAFMFSEVNGKPMVSYDEIGVVDGVPGYYPRFQGKSGEYTIYPEDANGNKIFIPYTSLESTNDAIKARHINVGLFRDDPDDPITMKALESVVDLGSSFFFRNNRFLNEALDFREIAR